MRPHPANEQMVDRLIAEAALWSPALVAAFRATPRHRFVDRVFVFHRKSGRWREVVTREPGPRELEIVYSDRALTTHLSKTDSPSAGSQVPISSSSQPSLMAQMLEDLDLKRGLRLLEIGAGTGYNAALLAHVVGPGQVTSVDVDRNVLSEAWDHLRAFPERRIDLRQADGRQGVPERAPFDRILVTAATPDLEPAWLEQLADGGLLVAPLALAAGLAYIVVGKRVGDTFKGRLTRPAYFMALRYEEESGLGEADSALPAGSLDRRRAPWAGWFHRRSGRSGWFGLLQALAFFGYLRGLNIHYRTDDNGGFFGVSVSETGALCWFGEEDWEFTALGEEVGQALWQAFLEAGGPRPTEFQLWLGLHAPPPQEHGRLYARPGPRWSHHWELPERRDRPVWY